MSLARVKQGVREGAWQLKNLPRVLRHRLAPGQRNGASELTEALKREGIVSHPFQALITDRPDLLEAASARAHHLWAEARAAAKLPDGSHQGEYGRKDYKVALLPQRLSIQDPFVQFAIQPGILGPVNRYLGMRSMLRAIELWWDRPTPHEAKETQLWHRDGDDLKNVKVFCYFNDVDLDTGPFCFIPHTHPHGARRWLSPEHDVQGRSTDEQMSRVMPAPAWRICVGPAGTVTFCDTCGYHKGLKPTHHERLMLMVQYTSQTPRYPRVLRVTDGQGLSLMLTAAQRDAIGDVDGNGSGG